MQTSQINEQALLRLHAPWEEPDRYRQENEIFDGRRPSRLVVPRVLRGHVKRWRESGYEGVSETSRTLLNYWFDSEHLIGNHGIPLLLLPARGDGDIGVSV